MDTIEKAIDKQRRRNSDNTVGRLVQADSAVASIFTDRHVDKKVNNTADVSSTIETLINDPVEVNNAAELQNQHREFSKSIKVDTDRLEDFGFLSLTKTGTLLNQEFREIKRPLLQNIKGKTAHEIQRANLIQVTSALQGEGKTFTSINLALSIAKELDYRVLLIDADILKSSVSRTFGIEVDKGLTDYLYGDVRNLSEVMIKTSIPKLSLLPAGSRHHLSTELLNSKFMDNLIQELSDRYKDRVIIIDSPPLLQTNESRVLAQKVGQIVFVVEQNKTTQLSVKNALSLLDPEMVIGLVMNKSRGTSQGNYYGYGYGYGYGSE
jgi:receptor protein-tyrosine kinase